MQSKQRGDECAWPETDLWIWFAAFFRDLQEQPKEQQRVNGVEQNVGKMRPSRIQPVHGAIQHVRNPGQRMPIAGVSRDKGPLDSINGDPLPHDLIVEDVVVVIVIEELKAGGLSEHSEGDSCQN